jgi:hypothetical protein
MTTIFTGVLAVATLCLVVAAIWQHFDTVEAVRATNRLAEANETAAKDRRQTASAEFISKTDVALDQHRFDRITDDIQSHNSAYHLPKYPNKNDADVEEYITVFDELGYLVSRNMIEDTMAYSYFSYDIQKAWCNVTVQEAIRQERMDDKSKTAQTDPIFGDFERLAKAFLETDGLSCNDLDSPTASTTKKKKASVRR